MPGLADSKIKIDPRLSDTADVFTQSGNKNLRKTVTGRRRMAKTEMILAKMERRREMTRRACTASSQGGRSHSLRKTNVFKIIGMSDLDHLISLYS